MSDSKEVYLVAGGSGFLGRHIVEALQARGDRVSAFDIVQRYDDVPFYTGDVSNPASILSALKQSGATCLFHTISPIPKSGDDSLYHRVNVEGTQNIIDAAIAAKVSKLVFTSSASVVFDGSDIADVDEQTLYPPTAFDVYSETKTQAEELVIAANGKNGLRTVSLRPASIYGPGDRQAFPGFLNAYKRQQSHIQIGNNTNLFDWTYVGNLVHAHLLAADKLTSDSGVAGEAFFITNGDPIPFWNFPRMIWGRLAAAGVEPIPNKKPLVMPRFVGMIVGFIMEYIAYFTGKQATFTRFNVTFCCATRWHNISKARRLLGYEPLTTNEGGVEKTVNWWLSQQAKTT